MNLLVSMRYLVALDEHKHFARAAQACHVTQPALSNAIRALDAGRTAWNGVTPAALTMLQHERQAQLWLMRRRLADMHRFNLKETRWQASTGFESTFNINGLLFPIPLIERQGNPCVDNPSASGC